jgi:hypothetical protein
MISNDLFFTIVTDAVKAVLSGNRRIKIAFFTSWTLIFSAIVIASIAEGFEVYKNILQPIARNVSMKMRHRLKEFSVANSHFP